MIKRPTKTPRKNVRAPNKRVVPTVIIKDLGDSCFDTSESSGFSSLASESIGHVFPKARLDNVVHFPVPNRTTPYVEWVAVKEKEGVALLVSANDKVTTYRLWDMTATEKRDLITWLMKADPAASNRGLAKAVEVSHHTVALIRSSLAETEAKRPEVPVLFVQSTSAELGDRKLYHTARYENRIAIRINRDHPAAGELLRDLKLRNTRLRDRVLGNEPLSEYEPQSEFPRQMPKEKEETPLRSATKNEPRAQMERPDKKYSPPLEVGTLTEAFMLWFEVTGCKDVKDAARKLEISQGTIRNYAQQKTRVKLNSLQRKVLENELAKALRKLNRAYSFFVQPKNAFDADDAEDRPQQSV